MLSLEREWEEIYFVLSLNLCCSLKRLIFEWKQEELILAYKKLWNFQMMLKYLFNGEENSSCVLMKDECLMQSYFWVKIYNLLIIIIHS